VTTSHPRRDHGRGRLLLAGGRTDAARHPVLREGRRAAAQVAKAGQRIENDLQTNGTLDDEDWAKFLKANRFLVRLSIDGPKDVHDAMRPTKRGQPSFDEVVRGVEWLKRHGVPFNTLTCVHRHNAKRPLDVYRFLRRELHSTYLQFIPIVERRSFETKATGHDDASQLPQVGTSRAKPDHPLSVVAPWSVDPDEYGRFLCKVWDAWISRDLGKALVNFCETLVVQRTGRPSQLCIHAEKCGRGVAVEHDGSVYACDHYVYPEYRLGTIRDRSLRAMVLDPAQVKFGYAKSERLPEYCRKCAYINDCWGECPKNRIVRTPDGEPGLNYLCNGLKMFFAHAGPAADRMAAGINAASGRPLARMEWS
jgi:uncharacterized protein